jgi:hypothetical protein
MCEDFYILKRIIYSSKLLMFKISVMFYITVSGLTVIQPNQISFYSGPCIDHWRQQ